MKNLLKTLLAMVSLLAATPATRADFLKYTNSLSLTPVNPAEIGFSIPRFDSALGTLSSVNLNLSALGSAFSTWSFTNLGGGFTFVSTNAISFLYNSSNTLAQHSFIRKNLLYPT